MMVYFTKAEEAALREYAAKNGRSISSVVRAAVKAAIGKKSK